MHRHSCEGLTYHVPRRVPPVGGVSSRFRLRDASPDVPRRYAMPIPSALQRHYPTSVTHRHARHAPWEWHARHVPHGEARMFGHTRTNHPEAARRHPAAVQCHPAAARRHPAAPRSGSVSPCTASVGCVAVPASAPLVCRSSPCGSSLPFSLRAAAHSAARIRERTAPSQRGGRGDVQARRAGRLPLIRLHHFAAPCAAASGIT